MNVVPAHVRSEVEAARDMAWCVYRRATFWTRLAEIDRCKVAARGIEQAMQPSVFLTSAALQDPVSFACQKH